MKTCQTCRFRTMVKLGDVDVELCTGAPPTAIITANREVEPASFGLNAYYPPVPHLRCGAYRRRWWWTR